MTLPIKPNRFAMDVCHRATVLQLRDDAAELAKLTAELNEPLPSLPQSAFMLYRLLVLERSRAHRLVELFRFG
jgi:hypothetical protein